VSSTSGSVSADRAAAPGRLDGAMNLERTQQLARLHYLGLAKARR
jgi:hypothetical protein